MSGTWVTVVYHRHRYYHHHHHIIIIIIINSCIVSRIKDFIKDSSLVKWCISINVTIQRTLDYESVMHHQSWFWKMAVVFNAIRKTIILKHNFEHSKNGNLPWCTVSTFDIQIICHSDILWLQICIIWVKRNVYPIQLCYNITWLTVQNIRK
jgi:hypothetical protein